MKRIDGDIETALNPTLGKIVNKLNELVDDANDSLKSDIRLRNEIAALNKQIADMKKDLSKFHMALMNRG